MEDAALCLPLLSQHSFHDEQMFRLAGVCVRAAPWKQQPLSRRFLLSQQTAGLPTNPSRWE